jgi:nickel transport protein
MCKSVRVLCTVLAAAAMLTGGVAHAHKLKLFAMGEGKEISGYAYFPGGGRAVGLTVQAMAPDGSKLGEATTNAQGEFTIPATRRCDYTLVAQTIDGHKATFVVEAAELVDDLPAFGAAPSAEATVAESPSPAAAPAEPAAAPISDERALSAIDRAVRKHVDPLREQLESYEERRRSTSWAPDVGRRAAPRVRRADMAWSARRSPRAIRWCTGWTLAGASSSRRRSPS